jgi:hypothetical protein
MPRPGDARHQSYANLEQLWGAGHPQILPLSGEPWCQLQLEPREGLLRLQTVYALPEPDVAKLRRLSFAARMEGDREVAELVVMIGENLHGAYGLLTGIADALQVEGVPLASAVSAAVARYREVLTLRPTLTEQELIGLFGELLFLDHLISRLGPGRAIESWQGPLAEEHDFVFPDLHVEVKTTTNERRRHTIAGVNQLVPLPSRPLHLVSVQLTRTAADLGLTLASLIAAVRERLVGYSPKLDLRLDRQGWTSEDADLYQDSWTLRSAPRAYAVDDRFPALTPRLLEPVVPNFGLVSDVLYRVDVTDLDPDSIPEPYAGFVDPKGPWNL